MCCNDPKPLCQDHHGFGVLLNFFWLWYFVKHFVDLLVYMCYLQNGLLISALGFTDVFICVLQQITRRYNHGTYLNHMQYDRQAKTSQICFYSLNRETCYNEEADLECSTNG